VLDISGAATHQLAKHFQDAALFILVDTMHKYNTAVSLCLSCCKRMQLRSYSALLVAMALAGCAQVTRVTGMLGLQGQPGSAEAIAAQAAYDSMPSVQVATSNRSAVIAAIVRNRTGDTWALRSASESEVVRARTLRGLESSMRWGTSINATPEERVIYTVVRTGPGLRIYAQSLIVQNPSSMMEIKHDLTARSMPDLQRDLMQLRMLIERDNRPQ
jgi:hypothetical protein